MNVLVIDIGGLMSRFWAASQNAEREFASGPNLTPQRMVAEVRKGVAEWKYNVVTIGYPGPVRENRPVSDPWNLEKGWVGFNFKAAFKHPGKIVNDAVMQALGGYKSRQDAVSGAGNRFGINPDPGWDSSCRWS